MDREMTAPKLIEEALFQLMEKKNFEEITVTDIAERAGVSRLSFYRNFQSKTEIITKYLDESFLELDRAWDHSEDRIIQLFQHFIKNRRIIALLYKANRQYLVLEHLTKLFRYDRQDTNVVAYAKAAWAHFTFGWLDEWYKRGMQESPETMVALMEETFGPRA